MARVKDCKRPSIHAMFTALLILLAPLFISAQSSYVSVEVGLSTCFSPTAIFVDDNGVLFETCSQGLIMKHGDTITTLYNSTECDLRYNGGIIRNPITGALYFSCDKTGVMQLSHDGIVTRIVNQTDCRSVFSFASGTFSQNFLVGVCVHDMGTTVIRLNLATLQIQPLLSPPLCIDASDLTYFEENGAPFIVVACSSGIVKLNLNDRSSSVLATQNECAYSKGLARDSSSGILYASCSSGLIQINGTNITSIVADSDCKSAGRLLFDERTSVLYGLCNSPRSVVAVSGSDVVTVLNVAPCPAPVTMAKIDRSILLMCANSVLRISGTTTSEGVPFLTCSDPVDTVIDAITGARVSACSNGIVETSLDGSSILLANASLCETGFNGLTMRDNYLYVACMANSMFRIQRQTLQNQLLINRTSATMGGYYVDQSESMVYYNLLFSGIYGLNLTSGSSRLLFAIDACYQFDPDLFTNSLYMACGNDGVKRYDMSSGLVSTINPASWCFAFRVSVATDPIPVGSSPVLYVTCHNSLPFGATDALAILAVNGSSSSVFFNLTQFSCPSVQSTAYSSSSRLLLVMSSCDGTSTTFGLDTTTRAIIPLIPADQSCLIANSIFQDPRTLAVWTACGTDGPVAVSAMDFTCYSGTFWQLGACIPCNPNTYRPHSALSPFGRCYSCSSGSVALASGSASCTPCPAGSYKDSTSNDCVLCPLGKYQPNNGTDACIDCQPGSFAVQPGRTQCSSCNPGFFSSAKGAVSCSPCNSGSASNATGLDRPCDGCPPGQYQAGLGQTSCFECPVHSYSEQANSTSCTRCANQVNADRTACHIVICDPNSQFNVITNQCETCPLSQYSGQGGLCSTCVASTYTPAAGSGCASCEGIEGLYCSGGIAQVMQGYWAYISDDEQDSWPKVPPGSRRSNNHTYQLYRTAACPFCPGSLLQLDDNALSLNTTIAYCIYPRLNSVNNTLCAQCADGFMAWGDSCVECDQVNGALVLAYLVLSFALVLFLFYSSTNISSAGYMSIFLFFIQTAALELGPIVRFLDWIQIANFDPKSAGSCLAPWSAFGQTLFALLVPVILIAELLIVAAVHFMLNRLIFSDDRSAAAAAAGAGAINFSSSASLSEFSESSYAPGSNKIITFFKIRLRRFSVDDYYVGTLSILLFCYTSVSTAILRYLHCVEIGSQSLNFSAPTIDCRSNEYKHYLVPVIMSLILYIIGLPLIAGIKLWRSRESLYMPTEPSSPQSSRRPDSPIQKFLHHWSPFYRMYQPHAWFWTCAVLLRRAAFVVTAVLLMQKPSQRFMVFAFLHLVSLLLHFYVRPYESQNLNHMETTSYVLLLSISLLLTANMPPYDLVIQVILFFLIVPPAIWMFGVILMERYQQWKHRRNKPRSAPQQHSRYHEMRQQSNPHFGELSASLIGDDTPVELSTVHPEALPKTGNYGRTTNSILPNYAFDSEQQQL